MREHRPTALIVGSHHYVQLSEIDLKAVGIRSGDLKSVKAITPSGAAVPPTCRWAPDSQFGWRISELRAVKTATF